MRITLRDLRQAVRANPNDAAAANFLGQAHVERGEAQKSLKYFRKAIKLKPEQPMYYRHLAKAIVASTQYQVAPEQHEEAARNLWTAIKLAPSQAAIYYELGLLYVRFLGDQAQARKLFLQAFQLSPGRAEIYIELCREYIKDCSAQEAISRTSEDIRHIPSSINTYDAMANLLQDYGRYEESKEYCLKSLAVEPRDMRNLMGVGGASLVLRDLEAAKKYYDRMYELYPSNYLALTWYFKYLFRIGCHQQARDSLSKAEVKPIFLQRFRDPLTNKHLDSKPEWDGSPALGKTILLYGAYGYGDAIQFLRYAAQIKESGAKVIVQCQKPLHSIIRTIPGVDLVVDKYDECPPFDFAFEPEMMSAVVGWDLASINRRNAYLLPPAAVSNLWSKKFAGVTDLKVGINGVSNCSMSNNPYRFRSFPLEQLRSLANIPGVKLYNLQVRKGDGELATGEIPFPATDIGIEFRDFVDTAAAIQNLDLVISADTSMAHVAGAVGKPCWLMAPYFADWRWMLDCTDSFWYQSMKIFRQVRPGDWASVASEIAQSLSTLALKQATNPNGCDAKL
jgi:tetratricopeptide (TPR) repeat protein